MSVAVPNHSRDKRESPPPLKALLDYLIAHIDELTLYELRHRISPISAGERYALLSLVDHLYDDLLDAIDHIPSADLAPSRSRERLARSWSSRSSSPTTCDVAHCANGTGRLPSA